MSAEHDPSFEIVIVAYANILFRTSPDRKGGYTKGNISKESSNAERMNVSHTMNEPDPCLPLILPPRYRLRDLILGDYAFNDDGER